MISHAVIPSGYEWHGPLPLYPTPVVCSGRQSPGKAFRLYTLESYEALEEHTKPEILRTSLAEVVLKLKSLGVDDVLGFDFLNPPPTAALLRSLQLLHLLGALDGEGHITNGIGRQMSQLPLEPTLSRMLIAAMAAGSNCPLH